MDFHNKPNVFCSHVTIKVQQLQRSLLFYQEVVGFQVLEKTETIARLTVDGETSILTLEQPEGATSKQEKTTGLYHYALLLPNRVSLAQITKHLMKGNIPLAASDHLVSEAIYFSDPDGNGIEIYTDRPSSEWKWRNERVQMAVDPLDFEDLLSQWNGKKWRHLPKGTIMGHIHLHVAELEEIEEFYCKGLGFDVVSRMGNQALFISTGGYHHHIGLNTWNGRGAPAPSENTVGLKEFSLVLPDEGYRQEVVERLNRLRAWVEVENGVVLTKDPSQNLIRLLV